MPNIIVFCERSGVVREALRRRGVNAWSNDIERADDGSRFHIQLDARQLINDTFWDGFIAHPECRFLSVSGQHWNSRGATVDGRPRSQLTVEALEFAQAFFDSLIPHKIIENPISILSTRIKKPSQIIQPWQFGSNASKATCLWLENVPPLIVNPLNFVAPRKVFYNGKIRDRWSNQTDSGQNRLGPSETRSTDRARTYPGIAEALADAMVRSFA